MSKNLGRRKFLGTMSCAALGYTTFYNSILNLKSINALCASNSALDPEYKALVCILLSGGNDSFNMLIPTSTSEYNTYKTTRSNIALNKSDLVSITSKNTPGRTFGLHPELKELGKMFNNGKACFVSNIGTLVEPTTKADFLSGKVKVPDALFSHSDQAIQWQTSIPTGKNSIGWAGRMADLIKDMNTSNEISMNISLSGTNIFEVGNEVIEYVIDPNNGSIGISGYGPPRMYNDFDNARSKAIDSLLTQSYADAFSKTYSDIVRSARDNHIKFEQALSVAPTIQTQFPDSYLAASLKMIARTISTHQDLGFKRQVFFLDYSGWDHHDEVINNQNQMFGDLDASIIAFQKALEELNVDKQVCTFTMSEFGRTLNSNGNGTDHAWGGNVFSFGGSINGGYMYGKYPLLNPSGANVIYDSAVIPTTPTETYFAELALWMGVSPSDLHLVLPSIGKFYDVQSSQKPLGFLKF